MGPPDDRWSKMTSDYRPTVHARKDQASPAVCGAVGFMASTTHRSEVTCEACMAEIERRLMTPGRGNDRRPPAR